jgi:uncharacterized cupin superfamily protein
MVGDELVALLDGTLAMRLNDGNLVIEPCPAQDAEGK